MCARCCCWLPGCGRVAKQENKKGGCRSPHEKLNTTYVLNTVVLENTTRLNSVTLFGRDQQPQTQQQHQLQRELGQRCLRCCQYSSQCSSQCTQNSPGMLHRCNSLLSSNQTSCFQVARSNLVPDILPSRWCTHQKLCSTADSSFPMRKV